jgi:hypothetical protein
MRKGTVLRSTRMPWMDETIEPGTVVYEYVGYTYGVIGEGVAVTREPRTFPFFELPESVIEWEILGWEVLE